MLEKLKIKTKIYNLSLLFAIFSIFIFVKVSSEKLFNLRNLLGVYEITITVKGKGTRQIINDKAIEIYDSISNRKKNYRFNYMPSEILVNGESVDYIGYYVYNLTEEENNITIKFDTTIENCDVMFYGLENILKIDCSQFDTSQIRSMKGMFYSCKILESLNLRNFDTSSLTDMGEMFRECGSLTSLDLTSFNTMNVIDMEHIFNIFSKKYGKNVYELQSNNIIRFK